MCTADRMRSGPMARSTAVGKTAVIRVLLITILAFVGMTSCVSEADGLLRSKESVLKQDLFVLREQIDNYTLDKKKAPQSLQDLVAAGYLKWIPPDPFTGSEETWITAREPSVDKNGQIETGITDVHSGSNLIGRDGTRYNTW
jgi:general secretion pathway protein G